MTITTEFGGLLGAALEANRNGRLSHFIVDETSPAIALFAPDVRAHNREGDWYGEHAGKWLIAAARCAARTGDARLRARVERVCDWLIAQQEADGYLGNYAPERRFTQPQASKPGTWDGAPAQRTWDVWTHAHLLLGLIEVHRHFGGAARLAAACRIGDLCARVFGDGGSDITDLGNHHGLSATVLLDAVVELYFASGEARYLDLAKTLLAQAERNPALRLRTRLREGADASEIATGKAYQLCWNLVALAKLARATHDDELRDDVRKLWRNIRDHHLSLGGGPGGGVGQRSREVFNPAGFFSPYAYVETCSSLAWIQLNRELLADTGEAQFAEEIERNACNDLLAAQAPDGEDWCYYVFANGRRVHTTYWRCCKSSGALALEEVALSALSMTGDGTVSLNLLGPMTARLAHPRAGELRIEQLTHYPADGVVRVRVMAEKAARFALRLRVPAWAQGATLQVDHEAPRAVTPGEFAVIQRDWHGSAEIALTLPLRPRLHRAVQRNVQESRAPDGAPVAQEVQRMEYAAVSRGALVYATGLIDGYKFEETIRLPDAAAESWLIEQPSTETGVAPRVELRLAERAAIVFEPWYAAGGRRDGVWRVTWLSLAPAG